MLLHFQYLLIAAILISISMYMYISLQIFEDSQSANDFIPKIIGVASFSVLISAAALMKGILLNAFLGFHSSPRYQVNISMAILVTVVVSSVVLINHRKHSYFYSRRKELFAGAAGFVAVIPVHRFDMLYYISTVVFLVAAGSFLHKGFFKYRMRHNVGLYFLFIASTSVVAAVVLSYYFEPLFFNTFNMGLLTFVMLGFFVFYISHYHEELNHKMCVLTEQEQTIKSKNRKLKEAIYQDAVVGIPNRIAFEEAVLENGDNCYVGLLNIRDFMSYNKLLGFARGNQILQELARILIEINTTNTTVYRYYSDKFIIIFKTNCIEEATHLAMATQSTIESMKFQGVAIRTYMGLYYLTKEEISSSENCCTDLYGALETASSMARNTSTSIYHYHSDDHEKERFATSLEIKLMEAIEKKRFQVFYQPQYDSKKLEINSFEALIRWKDGTTCIAPNEFIPLAEKKGLMGPITWQVIDTVFRDVSEHAFFSGRTVAINLSADQLVEDAFIEYVTAKKKLHALEAQRIVFEITETSLFNDIEKVKFTLSTLRKMGFQLSIDDFGAGYSSLFRISEHEIDEVKFDKSFIDDFQNPKTYAIMKKTAELFNSFGIRVVVEGVEKKEQLEMIEGFMIDLYQGYHFCKPAPLEKLMEMFSLEKPSGNKINNEGGQLNETTPYSLPARPGGTPGASAGRSGPGIAGGRFSG
ncbi:bifunctional diguanylate cyclase/phosphodiesterase [Anoxynatronum buryatiense]|uniref:EAL domain, c-di-GMP-specific phosphodiesterase class I (Or its enzymatically inactive variant) n=1 Tax=Anoxynatronum buryatiense TaxID=489973 RepID=A0AA46AJN0_9CLOT|nr:bifunctional diguanylate cyclase/phosphodiesterase [Anoxynatronum buryatiense]SMP61894.1 EAL domain, c-di-GMP-specific phosphodiesterase class I (or its enzymatically inactive variant) [Anoxynatronum buryatiense]